LKKNKRDKNHKKCDKKSKPAPVAASPDQQPEDPEDEGNNDETPAPQKTTFWHVLKKLKFKVEWVGVTVAFFLLVATGYNTYLTRQALYTSQRAFLFYDGAQITTGNHKRGQNVSGPVTVMTKITNSGQTAARRTKVIIAYCQRLGGLPKGFSFPYTNTERNSILIAPRGAIAVPLSLEPKLLPELELGHTSITVYGEAEYVDIFEVKHITQFCINYKGLVVDGDTGDVKEYLWSNCDQHNCADDDCPQQWGEAGVDCCSPERCL
jgi:hypothetical protein